MLDTSCTNSPVDHIVVLMMENRSTDHYLGWLAQDTPFLEAGLSRYGEGFGFRGDQQQAFPDELGTPQPTYDIVSDVGQENAYRGCGHPDPGHGWGAGRAQRDGGFLAPGSGNDRFALSYYNAESLPMHAMLARNFTSFDQYHCSVLGPTFPNREYMHSAQSGGIKNNSLPPQVGGAHTFGFTWDTIWDRLTKAGVSCGYYFVDLPASALWGPRLAPITHHVERYFADAAAGTLPQVVFVDPGFTTGFRTDDHPHADIRAGQKYIFDVFKAFYESSCWEHGAFIVNYDEWGGFFDQAAPPVLPDDRTSLDDNENFGQAGFRVPALMASPFAQPGFVDHSLYDHTSILRFIEWRYLGAPANGPGPEGPAPWSLTARDRHANNIGASLVCEPVSREIELGPLPEVPVESMPCEGDALSGVPGVPKIPGVTSSESPGHDGFTALLESGWAESMGFRIDPRLPRV